jgi:hypothetical protein
MPAKKPKNSKPAAAPKRTPKRKTAIPAVAPARRASKPVAMRLVVPPAVDPIQPSHDMIAKRAFQIWERYVRLVNDPVGHWLEAEKQLREELNPPAAGVA